MRVPRRTILAATAATATVAGCIGSDDEGDEAGSPDGSDESEGENGAGADPYGTASDGESERATVRATAHPEYDDILVGADGLTLYMFDRDTQGDGASACYVDCAEAWPPLETENPVAGDGVTAELTTFEREDGTPQVAADGWPLYYFAQDEEPGDVEGQGANDVWWVLRPDGTPVRPNGDRQGDDRQDDDRREDEHDHDVETPDAPVERAEVAMRSDDGHHFDPHLVWIEPGGTVTWTLESGSHTATAYHSAADRPDRIPREADGWDSGFLGDEEETFERSFDVEGVYDYFCRPHESAGMVGSIVVGDPDPHDQPALEPPQTDVPDEARAALKELNGAVDEMLGHTHE